MLEKKKSNGIFNLKIILSTTLTWNWSLIRIGIIQVTIQMQKIGIPIQSRNTYTDKVWIIIRFIFLLDRMRLRNHRDTIRLSLCLMTLQVVFYPLPVPSANAMPTGDMKTNPLTHDAKPEGRTRRETSKPKLPEAETLRLRPDLTVGQSSSSNLLYREIQIKWIWIRLDTTGLTNWIDKLSGLAAA